MNKLLTKLIVVDIAPKYYKPHHQNIFNAFKSIKIDDLSSRKEAEELLIRIIPEFGVRQFILKNLGRNSNGFYWKINYKSLEKNIENVSRGIPDQLRFAGNTLFISGENSDYINLEDHPVIKRHFPQSSVSVVKNAGHWVHAENPSETLRLIQNFLK